MFMKLILFAVADKHFRKENNQNYQKLQDLYGIQLI